MYELDKKGAFKAAAPEAIALVSARARPRRRSGSRHGHRRLEGSADMSVGDPVVSMRDILSGKHILRRHDFHND